MAGKAHTRREGEGDTFSMHRLQLMGVCWERGAESFAWKQIKLCTTIFPFVLVFCSFFHQLLHGPVDPSFSTIQYQLSGIGNETVSIVCLWTQVKFQNRNWESSSCTHTMTLDLWNCQYLRSDLFATVLPFLFIRCTLKKGLQYSNQCFICLFYFRFHSQLSSL